MKALFVVFISFLIQINNPLKAQNIFIYGKIVDMYSGEPIYGARVQVTFNNTSLDSSSNRESGDYYISLKKNVSDVKISFNYKGYEPIVVSEKLSSRIPDKNGNIFLGIQKLKPVAILLNEVKIKKPKRYRDTTIIDLSKKKFERSIMIDDVLSGAMGFSKGKDGILYYKGKVVSSLKVNNSDFFGKNNLEIYKDLPALILSGIQIVETDIDSISNITTKQPTIKVNLSLKEKYNNGKFGNGSVGAGSLKRFLGSSCLFSYRKNEQISLLLNSNNINIGDNNGGEPIVNFSANGNDVKNQLGSLSYRNVFWKKFEITANVNGKKENKLIRSVSERNDELLNQYSKIYNSSAVKQSSLNNSSIVMNFNIDTNNLVKAAVIKNIIDLRQDDSLNYHINSGDSSMFSEVKKARSKLTQTLKGDAIYSHTFSKKGRAFDINIQYDQFKDDNHEKDQIRSIISEQTKTYNVTIENKGKEVSWFVNAKFMEPINESSNLVFALDYKKDYISFQSSILVDTLPGTYKIAGDINNEYVHPNITYRKEFHKISTVSNIGIIQNMRFNPDGRLTFYNFDVDLKADYAINKINSISARVSVKPTYPTKSQLTNIDNSFDLVSQRTGNPDLRAENKHEIELNYINTNSESLTANFLARFDLYTSKFGNSIVLIDKTQQNMITNLGDAVSFNSIVNLAYTLKSGQNLNYTFNINYQQLPSITNAIKDVVEGTTVIQSISTNKLLFHNSVSLAPTISVSNSRYNYGNNKNTTMSATYSDKYSILIKKFNFSVFPFFNYNKSLSDYFVFAANAEIRKDIFKKYGSVWFKVYDIFNSFKFTNNIISNTYSESVTNNNLRRYFLIGISMKFNNMR